MPYTPGPFDSAHVYVQWGGKLPGNEAWSCGLRLYNAGGGALTNDPAVLAAATAAITAFHNRATSYISSSAKLSFVKANVIGTDGHYVASTTLEQVVADVPGGGSASNPYPNQVALAVSLVTGFSRGPAHRGRFYLPMPYAPVGSDGLISSTDRDLVKTSATTMLTALNAMSSNLKVGVFSRKLGVAGHRAVTGIEVGRVLDTQRRRRRSLKELY